MRKCINKNSVEYQTLKNRSGINESDLESTCMLYLELYNRFPYLDELKNSNSEPYLKLMIGINKHNGVNIENLLTVTGASDVREATIRINNDFRDLETRITPIVKEAIVDINHRPTNTNFNVIEVEQDEMINDRAALTEIIGKLGELYGININYITEEELNSDEWRDIITEPVNAFVYNGQVYINVDYASTDAPIHELMHLFIGSIRFQEPLLYQQLIELAPQIPNYEFLLSKYLNRTRSDVNEEIIITELSKYLAGLKNNLNELNPVIVRNLIYNVKRVLDTVLMGQDSVKTISHDRLYKMSLKELAKELNSSTFINLFTGTFNVEGSAFHRKLNNIKSDLLKSGSLIELCN